WTDSVHSPLAWRRSSCGRRGARGPAQSLRGHWLKARNNKVGVVSRRYWDLVLQHDLAPLPGRLHDGQTYLQRSHAPAAVVPDRLASDNRVVELLQLCPSLSNAAQGSDSDEIDVLLAL